VLFLTGLKTQIKVQNRSKYNTSLDVFCKSAFDDDRKKSPTMKIVNPFKMFVFRANKCKVVVSDRDYYGNYNDFLKTIRLSNVLN
jgi:hypothetical protein